MKCPKCGMWNTARAEYCECGQALTRAAEQPAGSPRRQVAAGDVGAAIAESLGAAIQSRGLTKEGRRLPALAKSASLREELGYVMTSAVYVSLCGGQVPRERVNAVFNAFLENCSDYFPQGEGDDFSPDTARKRATEQAKAFIEARGKGLGNEECFAMIGQKYSEIHPEKKERPALRALGSLLFGTVLVNVADFMAKITGQYEIGG